MILQDIRDEMRRMRHGGATLEEIGTKFLVGKSTVHYIVKDITMPEDKRLEIENKWRERAFTCLTLQDRKTNGRKGGKQCQLVHGSKAMKNLQNGWIVSGLTYRQDELPILSRLNTLYDTIFKKEQIGRLFLDFANAQYIIEVSYDNTTGITDLIRRFEAVDSASDPRHRVAYVTKAVRRSPRRERLLALNVEICDVNTLSGP